MHCEYFVVVVQGGRHVDYITDQIISKLLDVVKRKEKKAGVTIKPFQVTVAFCFVLENDCRNKTIFCKICHFC